MGGRVRMTPMTIDSGEITVTLRVLRAGLSVSGSRMWW